jgi:S-adenosylmethionine-diacylglycerol 3-amino-3-carboxypropyl transferase
MDAATERPAPTAEVALAADFSAIHYAQCWEDADVLLQALAIRSGDRCLSVASGGENSLSLLMGDPCAVVAVDLSPVQIALVELKRSAIRLFDHADALRFVGLAPCADRLRLYRSLRPALPSSATAYWDANQRQVAGGVCACGRFERYLALFRRFVLPLIHTRAEVDLMFVPRTPAERRRIFNTIWNNRRWRALYRLFFSRAVMARIGRDPSFFRYVEDDVGAAMAARVERGLTEGDPAANPYLHWFAYGRYADSLPHAWRAENFEVIRSRVDRLELRTQSIEAALAAAPAASIDRFNLSDIFEYVSPPAATRMFEDICRCGRPAARVAYWNMMVLREAPPHLAGRIRHLDEVSRCLHRRAATYFYRAFRVDEVAVQADDNH